MRLVVVFHKGPAVWPVGGEGSRPDDSHDVKHLHFIPPRCGPRRSSGGCSTGPWRLWPSPPRQPGQHPWQPGLPGWEPSGSGGQGVGCSNSVHPECRRTYSSASSCVAHTLSGRGSNDGRTYRRQTSNLPDPLLVRSPGPQISISIVISCLLMLFLPSGQGAVTRRPPPGYSAPLP